MGSLYFLEKNILSRPEIDALIRYIEADPEPDHRPHYQHKGIYLSDVYGNDIPELDCLKGVVRLCNKVFNENYSFKYNRFELKRLFGNIMTTGAENEAHDDDGDVYPGKPEIEEHYSAILMLSDDYSGGELFFQHHNHEIKLEAGDLIMFRGNAENLHGVREVTSGKRVNVIIFFRNYPLENPIDDDQWLEFIGGPGGN